MNKETLYKQLQELESRLESLIKEHRNLKNELEEYKRGNVTLKNTLSKQKEELDYFHNKDKISKIVSSIAEDTHKNTELKLKINEYIKEIDKCIAYLSDN